MKIEDLAFAVAGEALNLLEQNFHYRISDDHKKAVQKMVTEKLADIIEAHSGKPEE